MDATIYTLLLWAIPLLLTLLAFIGALAVNALIQLSRDVSNINISLEVLIAKHDNLEKRVDTLENHTPILNGK